MTTIVFTTSTADAMAKQCMIFLKEYCEQQKTCDTCALNIPESIKTCPYLDIPQFWEASNDT